MGDKKRLQISLPDNLMNEVESYLASGKTTSNSEFFQEAVRVYLAHLKRDHMKQQLRNGYLEMSDLNRDLADEGLLSNQQAITFYEDNLAGCD